MTYDGIPRGLFSVLRWMDSAVMLASKNGYTEIVKLLIESKASLDLQQRVSDASPKKNLKFYLNKINTKDK